MGTVPTTPTGAEVKRKCIQKWCQALADELGYEVTLTGKRWTVSMAKGYFEGLQFRPVELMAMLLRVLVGHAEAGGKGYTREQIDALEPKGCKPKVLPFSINRTGDERVFLQVWPELSDRR